MTDEGTMFGLPGAEHLHSDPCDAYEAEIEPFDEKDDPEVVWIIEEWTCGPVKFDANRAATLAEQAGEMLCDDTLFDEDGAQDIQDAAEHSEVIAAFQAALDLLSSKVRYRVADKKVAEHRVTHDAAGEPYLNGERMWPTDEVAHTKEAR